jgi:hypothetical protein
MNCKSNKMPQLALAVLVAFASDSWGQSKRPPTKNQQEQAQSEQQKAAPDQRGTEQLPFIVQPLPAKKTAEIIENEKREAKEKANSDWWTWALGIFTIIALFGQLTVFIAQAYFLWGTLKATAIAAKAGSDSVAASVDAFNKLERPYIFVSNVQRFFHDDKRAPMGIASVAYQVGNHGKTPAIIENVRAVISSGTEPDTPIRVDDQHDLFVCRVVPPLHLQPN